jgi:hypothetical protein
LGEIIYNRDFFHARATTYAVVAAYIAFIMLFDPFEYACSEDNPCPGCGFRTGIWLILAGNITKGFASNPLVAPALIAFALACLDLLVGAIKKIARLTAAPSR